MKPAQLVSFFRTFVPIDFVKLFPLRCGNFRQDLSPMTAEVSRKSRDHADALRTPGSGTREFREWQESDPHFLSARPWHLSLSLTDLRPVRDRSYGRRYPKLSILETCVPRLIDSNARSTADKGYVLLDVYVNPCQTIYLITGVRWLYTITVQVVYICSGRVDFSPLRASTH